MDWNVLRSLTTAVLLAVFVGIVIWAWSGKQRDRFESAARIPLNDEDAAAPLQAGDRGSRA